MTQKEHKQSHTHIVVHSFHCGKEFAGIWGIQICSVVEVGQGEVKSEIPGCWFWCSCDAPGCDQRGEGLGISYKKKLFLLSNLIPAHLKATLNNLFPSDFIRAFLLLRAFPEMNLAK